MAERSAREPRDDRRGDGHDGTRSGTPRGRRDGDGGRRQREGRPFRPHRDGEGAGRPRREGGRDGAAPRPGRPERAQRERPAHSPSDLRAANRVDQQRSPDVDGDVTGKELDRGTLKEIGGLDERPATWVAKHLVMAGRYIDEDPELAFQHALAASRKGGRLARVREAVALTAYAAGEYHEALREFRTYRRMTGDDTHIAAQVDSERALGRHEKALQLAGEVDTSRLDRAARVELAMVVSGVREDLGDLEGALAALKIPELDRRRGYPFSPRLFQRQADVLTALGRTQEAAVWQRSVHVAERALGIGGFAEPEIVDVEVEPAEDDRPVRGHRERHTGPRVSDASQASAESAPVGEGSAEEHGQAAPAERES